MRVKGKWKKGEMSRTIAIFCVNVLTITLGWAIVMKTLGAVFGWMVELSDVLTFAAAAFGGELLLLAFKRVFAKDDAKEANKYGLHQDY